MNYRYLMGLALVALSLLLSACGGNGSSLSGEPASVHVTETEFTIDSSVTVFSPGKTYHFAVTNDGKTAHEFMIMPKSEGSMSGMQMGAMNKVALASIDLINPGETKIVAYTFSSSAAGSHPELTCYFPGHYEAGMKLQVTLRA